ncbi:hypothetical protein [Streptomyces flaveus]|uniref:Uncharacterized protein n=1 Tax=Streptomyces flaveus TaxID=66370 RepID=A0A917VE52_9ACTN|nr:hypothetical protein [Streptomyces flaveus]GGK65291.1 hypothetical protein GCM10010094_27900 [Streptomyces flaveus]
MLRFPGGRPPGSRRVRLPALTGVGALAAALPLAVASAGPVDDRSPAAVRTSERVDDEAAASRPSPVRSPLSPGRDLVGTARCGPELTSPDGIEAQTCVLTQGRDTWARTYYRNATGDDLTAVLTLMAPGGRTVRMHCAVGADDEPGACETPRERTIGDTRAYTAVVEFAADTEGPLLLRSGSDSAT